MYVNILEVVVSKRIVDRADKRGIRVVITGGKREHTFQLLHFPKPLCSEYRL